jgi:signal transduction histidine kinase
MTDQEPSNVREQSGHGPNSLVPGSSSTEPSMIDGQAQHRPTTKQLGQLGSDQRAASERAALVSFITVRSMHVLQGVICLATGWHAYRRPRLALATLVAFVAESTWLIRRCWVRKAYNETMPAIVDVGIGLAGLGAIAFATTDEDRTAWLNWVCPLTFGTAAGTALATSRSIGAGSSFALGGTYVISVWPSMRLGGSQLATALANTTSYFNYYFAADRMMRRLRTDADRLEAIRVEIMLERERVATERERNRQHRLLHDSALQTLEVVARSDSSDLEPMRRQAQREATILRRAISGEAHRPDGLLASLETLADEFVDRGLRIELVIAELECDPDPAVSSALCGAAKEALVNVVKHAGVTGVVLRASSDHDGFTITIRDRGSGFDTSQPRVGFGISSSIIDRLQDVGGTAEIWSERGHGTRVDLWAPP